MRKVIAYVDDKGILYVNETYSTGLLVTSFPFEDCPDDKKEADKKEADIVKLVSLGVTADDLLKLKANGII